MKSSLKEINGRFYMSAKVVILSTNHEASLKGNELWINIEGKLKLSKPNSICPGPQSFQHLYFISDEEIKEGDWCFNSFDNQIWKYKSSPCPLPYWGNKDTLTKIIATTDSSLGLPQPSPSFIKAYIEEYNQGNVITDVLVEYYVDYKIHCEISREDCSKICGKSIGCELCSKANWKLKLDSNNTITTKKIKDSWNYEEHCLDMQYYMEYCERSGYVTPQEWINKYKHY